MKTITKEYKVYEFKELSREAKDKAIETWYTDIEGFDFLSDDMKSELEILLQDAGVEVIELGKIYYDLSYSQGSGAMFEGIYKWQEKEFTVKHSGHYYHYNSKTIDTEANKALEDAFNLLYVSICKKLEKFGYSVIEYRMNDDEFQEHCEANEYQFLENGKLFN